MASTLPRLHCDAARGEEGKLKQYLKAGDDVNARDSDGRTALFWAVCGDHLSCAEILLAAGADASTIDKARGFPLYVAVQNESIAIAKTLLQANADVNAMINRPDSGTALCKAAFTGNKDMVRLLLNAGCDTSKTAVEGLHPLTTASLEGHIDIVTMLLDAGADVSAVGTEGATALLLLLLAGAQKGSCDIIRRLLEGGADVKQITSVG